MTPEQQKIAQYLGEALATERALKRVLQSQIAMTPSGQYRDALQTHLRETKDHAERVHERLEDLGAGESTLAATGVLIESLLGQALALAKTPLDLLRGSGGEEKVLKNAKDAAATEALEIATYTAIERLAQDVGDKRTARLAREIRADEERMLDRVLQEIPQLTGKVVAADLRGKGSYDVARTGAGEAVRDAAESAADKSLHGNEPWPGYDEQNVQDIRTALDGVDASKAQEVAAYERRHKGRAGVLQATEAAVAA